jgi:hypothetical protein
MNILYIQISPETNLPDISGINPYLAVLVIEEQVEPAWRETVSKWLVKSGCIYMMAWGIDCSDWDTSVDLANIEQFNFGGIPEDEFVMITWHKNETLKDVFWQAKYSAQHACVEFSNIVILHISNENKEQEYLALYSDISKS